MTDLQGLINDRSAIFRAQLATLLNENTKYRQENERLRTNEENLKNELLDAKAFINFLKQKLDAVADQLQNSAKDLKQVASMQGPEQQQQVRENEAKDEIEEKNNNPDLDAENEPEQIRSSGKRRTLDETLTSKAEVQPGK